MLTLGAAAGKEFAVQVGTLVAIAILMTVGVYGLVAGIVKLDDLGLHLAQRTDRVRQTIGAGILRAAPWLMKGLSIAGTAAMFLVGGSILAHGIPAIGHGIEDLGHGAGAFGPVLAMLLEALVGIVAGAILVAAWTLVQHLRGKQPAHA